MCLVTTTLGLAYYERPSLSSAILSQKITPLIDITVDEVQLQRHIELFLLLKLLVVSGTYCNEFGYKEHPVTMVKSSVTTICTISEKCVNSD